MYSLLIDLFFDVELIAAAHDDIAGGFRNRHDLIDADPALVALTTGIATDRPMYSKITQLILLVAGL